MSKNYGIRVIAAVLVAVFLSANTVPVTVQAAEPVNATAGGQMPVSTAGAVGGTSASAAGAGETTFASAAVLDGKTSVTLLSAPKISGLSEYQRNVRFDSTATVTTAEGVSWEIPVLWINSTGTPVTLSALDEVYYPVFLFTVPKGYAIASARADGSLAIELPAFVNKLYGVEEGALFVTDAARGFAYIMPGPSHYNYDSGSRVFHGGSSSSSSPSTASRQLMWW